MLNSRALLRTLLVVSHFVAFATPASSADESRVPLAKGDRICLVGNALAERMQHHGWLETRLQTRRPDLQLSFRNLGFSADELTVQQRTSGFGSADDYLTRCRADVIFAFFGFNESFAGEDGLLGFKRDLAAFIDHARDQRYNGSSAPRIVLFTPIPIEGHAPPHAPDPDVQNDRILSYMKAMTEVARTKGVPIVNVFQPMKQRYAIANLPLTINGLHLTEDGNRELADIIEVDLFGSRGRSDPETTSRVRAAVLEKNLLWFNRYRATDGFNVYGGRSSLKYVDDLSNLTVLQREMQILDAMCDARDPVIAGLAAGNEPALDESRVPPPIPVTTNKPGTLPGGAHPFPTPEATIASLTIAKGMAVNLFADEGRFPEIANPVQMAWDTAGRLWIAAWPTYPHWEPGHEMNDKLVVLEDTDGDGVADQRTVFADDLHNPTGFEFWNGGVLVANCPDLLFLKDTDGDGRADHRERVLHGLSSADTHHSANSFVLGPDGAIYFQEGTFHQTQVETLRGPERSHNAAAWRFDPRTWEVERYVAYNFANPHGHVFDAWGQDFLTDGTGNVNYYVLPFSGRVVHPDKHRGYFPFFNQRSRPCAATEILSSSHFPEANRGNYLVANVIGFQGIFQYEIHDDGAGFKGVEVEPILSSSDPSFRPSDIEVGPDGAIYFLDWSNPIIGHMQHHLRDPSRDHTHGRVYRVTWPGRPLTPPAAIAGQPIEALLDLLKSRDDRVRYRARIELSGRDSARVLAAAIRWERALNPKDAAYDHHRLEALWLHQQHASVDLALLQDLLKATDHRARAAAVRVVAQSRARIEDPLALIEKLGGDPHPRVRLATIVAASYFDSGRAAAVALRALEHPTDKFIEYALEETMRTLLPYWKAALRAGEPIGADSPAGIQYLLGKVSEAELIQLPRVPAVLDALLTRHGVSASDRMDAAAAVAKTNSSTPALEILAAIERVDRAGGGHARHVLHDLGMILAGFEKGALPRDRLVALAKDGQEAESRQLAYAAITTIDGSFERAWAMAEGSREAVESFLRAIPMVADETLRATTYERVRGLMFHVPPALQIPGSDGASGRAEGLQVRFYPELVTQATQKAFAALTPSHVKTVSTFTLDLPDLNPPDAFALRFEGFLNVAKEGHYTLFTQSDDGSRLFIDGSEVVNNDGPHATLEKSGEIHLTAGSHTIEVNYSDQGGAQSLAVLWAGPGIEKQPIPASVLTTCGSDALRDAAIRAMAHIPGDEAEKLGDVARLIGEGSHVEASVYVIEESSADRWPAGAISPVVTSIAAYVAAQPPEMRTTPRTLGALEAGKKLASALPDAEGADAVRALSGLGGSTILIRTVPHEMLYDRREFGVVAGKPVAIVFQNNDLMPHNLVITRPGTMETVGKAAEAMSSPSAGTPDTNARAFIPVSPDVLWHSSLLNPGESVTIRFVAPTEPADYPYVCTFPGHWRVMNGLMRVFKDENALAAANIDNTATDTSGSAPARRFVKMWALADLLPRLEGPWKDGRDLGRGERLFTEVGCAKCHTFGDAGVRTGPPLAGISKKYRPDGLLREIIAPSTTVLEGYGMFLIETRDDTSVLGRIVDENDQELRIIPYMLDESKMLTIAKKNVRNRTPHSGSPMPEGVLVTLSQEEILDLIRYLQSDAAGER